MSKKSTTVTLTILSLPLGVVASAVVTALLSACVALVFPLIIFVVALRFGGELCNKVLDRYYQSNDNELDLSKNRPLSSQDL